LAGVAELQFTGEEASALLNGALELLVLGAGTIGLAVAEVCRIDHDAEVVLADRSAWRPDTAARLGFGTLHAGELHGLAGSWDVPVVFDCTGASEAVGLAMPLVAPGGRVVVVGFPATPASVDLADLALREISLVGTMSHLVTSDVPLMSPARSGCWPQDSCAPRR
jgi:threonine dehydrogenase-like Zn-dependent dehydrogenase